VVAGDVGPVGTSAVVKIRRGALGLLPQKGFIEQAEGKSALVFQVHLIAITGDDDGVLGVALDGDISTVHRFIAPPGCYRR